MPARRNGVVTRAQLLRLGFTEDEVPAVGPDRVRAATLATGPYAAASFSSATALHRLTPTVPAVLHVSLTRGERRNRPG